MTPKPILNWRWKRNEPVSDTLEGGTIRPLTVEAVFQAKQKLLDLDALTPDVPMDRLVHDADLSSPGLALAGYIARVSDERMLVFGETEMTYLSSISEAEMEDRLAQLFAFPIPAVFVTKGQEVPDIFLRLAAKNQVPVFRSRASTKMVFRRLKPFLESALAPTTTLHGSLADVYGVGLLFTGSSGIGKSECVLDLVERGHRLVADDLVIASRRGNDVLIGRGHERQQHHMEIRGIGIIDVGALFGIRAIRQQKRLEVVVKLEEWDDSREYSRTGLERSEAIILGVSLPEITIPLNPGKNLTVIAEVIAMNHLLKYAGVDSAVDFDRRLKKMMRPIREYLEEDYE